MAELNKNTSVVDYLKSSGQDSSFASRAKLAVEKGIVSDIGQYQGTAQQNTSLLGSLRSSSTPTTQNNRPTGSSPNDLINKDQENDFSFKSQEDEPKIRESRRKTEDIFKQANELLNQGLEQPDLPSFADRYTELRKEGGLGELESQLNQLDKEEQDIQARLRQRTNNEEGKPVALNVISGRVDEVTRQERENLEFVQRQKNFVTNQINAKNSVIETIMNLEQMDFENAESRYQTTFNNRKSTISLAMDLQSFEDDLERETEENARTNGELFVDTLVRSGRSATDLSSSQNAQLQRWGLESGLGKDFFFNMIEATENEVEAEGNDILTHVISSDKTQATILFKDGSTKTISTGLSSSGSGSSGDLEGFDLATEFSDQFTGTKEELKRELMRSKEAGDIDLGVSEINSIVATYERNFAEEELQTKAKDLVNEYFDPRFFDLQFTDAQELKQAKRKAIEGIDTYAEDSSIDGTPLSEADQKRLKDQIKSITIDDINL